MGFKPLISHMSFIHVTRLPFEFGTVCHTTSRLHSHCLFSAVVWRLVSSDAVFLDYTVVPATWHSSLWTR